MKKIVLCLLLLIGGYASSFAQQFTEVVYLKNGSIIKGVIVEQVPNVSLKIQTFDGSIFAYKMDEVEKITKENFKRMRCSNFAYDDLKGVAPGYRGFFDISYTIGVGDVNDNLLELSTSHGYQFNPQIYVGGGIAVHSYLDYKATAVPFFANFRYDFFDKKISPFFDFKLGYSFTNDVEGLYVSPTLGARFALTNNLAVNVGLGYTYQGISGKDYDDYYSDSSVSFSGISLKCGIEF